MLPISPVKRFDILKAWAVLRVKLAVPATMACNQVVFLRQNGLAAVAFVVPNHKIALDLQARIFLLLIKCLKMNHMGGITWPASPAMKILAANVGTVHDAYTRCVSTCCIGSSGVSDCTKTPVPTDDFQVRYTSAGPTCPK